MSAPDERLTPALTPDDSKPAPHATRAGTVASLRHRVGDLIKGRYEVIAHLGGGSFGSVYRVLDRAVGVQLACKEMHVLNAPQTSHNERAQAFDLFKREAQTLATLRHPHVPSAYYESEDGLWLACPVCGLTWDDARFCPEHGAMLLPVEGRYYLMMDFVDGPTLEEITVRAVQEERAIEEVQALEWIEGVAGALRALHRVGIVHRDVKPENVKVRAGDNAAVLLDFGLTKKSHEAGSYGTVAHTGSGRLGTRGYAPPDPREQSAPDARGDIHALGMTLLRLLTLREPNDPADLLLLRANPPRALNPAISPETERLLLRAIAPDRQARFRDADEFLDELHALTKTGSGTRVPFTFSDGARARTPGDLSRLLETHGAESLNYLFNGMFAEWLRGGGFGAAALAAERAVEDHRHQPARALEHFRRSLLPSGDKSHLPQLRVAPDIVDFGNVPSGAKLEKQVHLHNVGPGYLWGRASTEAHSRSPHERAPLPGVQVPSEWEGNDCTLTITLDASTLSPGHAIGWLRITPDVEGAPTHEAEILYTVVPLRLEVEPATLDFGIVPIGTMRERKVRVRRADEFSAVGDGLARGTISGGESVGPLFYPDAFEGEEPWAVTLDGARPGAEARRYEGALSLATNGGRLRLPVRYELTLPPERALGIAGTSALLGAGCALLVRVLALLWDAQRGWRWLAGSGAPATGIAPQLSHNPPGLVLFGAVVGLVGALLFNRRHSAGTPGRRALDQIFGRSLPLAGVFAGAGLGWLLGLIFPLLLWGVGDWLLLPPARALGLAPRNGAASGLAASPLPVWTLCGALLGTLWGAARVLEIKGVFWARYAAWIAFALLFLVALANAVLSGV